MIKAKNIHKSYGDLEVLKGVDLEIKTGEIVFGFLFSMLSTASLLSVLLFQFGDKCQDCDQIAFWGYAMPMHFFPFLAWYTLKPMMED